LVANISLGGVEDGQDGILIGLVDSVGGQDLDEGVVEEVEVNNSNGERSVNNLHVGVSRVSCNGSISASQDGSLGKEFSEMLFEGGQGSGVGGVIDGSGEGSVEESLERGAEGSSNSLINNNSQQTVVGEEKGKRVFIADGGGIAVSSSVADVKSEGVQDNQDSVEIGGGNSESLSSLSNDGVEEVEGGQTDLHGLVDNGLVGFSVVGNNGSSSAVQSSGKGEERSQKLDQLSSSSGVVEKVKGTSNSVEERNESSVGGNVGNGSSDEGIHQSLVSYTKGSGVSIANGGRSGSCSADTAGEHKGGNEKSKSFHFYLVVVDDR